MRFHRALTQFEYSNHAYFATIEFTRDIWNYYTLIGGLPSTPAALILFAYNNNIIETVQFISYQTDRRFPIFKSAKIVYPVREIMTLRRWFISYIGSDSPSSSKLPICIGSLNYILVWSEIGMGRPFSGLEFAAFFGNNFNYSRIRVERINSNHRIRFQRQCGGSGNWDEDIEVK